MRELVCRIADRRLSVTYHESLRNLTAMAEPLPRRPSIRQISPKPDGLEVGAHCCHRGRALPSYSSPNSYSCGPTAPNVSGNIHSQLRVVLVAPASTGDGCHFIESGI